jgi:hypothetical protein
MQDVRLRSPFGQELLLVPAHAVRRIGRAEAEQLVRGMLERDDGRARLRELARVASDEPIDDERIVDIVAAMLSAGDLVVVELAEAESDWHPPRAAPATRLSDLLPTRPLSPPERVEEPALLRVELGSTGFGPLGVLTLPRGDGVHPWAALVTVALHLRDHPGAGLVLVGHAEPGEPPQSSRLRADALLHFVTDDRAAWLVIAAKWGRVRDTQQFLAHLARDEGWPITPPEPTDMADDATARAVLAFQRACNAEPSRTEALFEDGVIGEQTLGAIYDLARESLARWLAANGLAAAAWGFHDSSRRALDCGERFKPFRTMPPLPKRHGGRFVDLVVVPADAAGRVALDRAPQGAGVYDVASIGSLPLRGITPPSAGLLALELALRDDTDRPMNGARFEVVDPAGALHTGTLDEHGEARLAGIPPGQCTIRFPELAPGRWFLEGTTAL